jgi:SOS response regulatory protein OraA/RecX
LKSSEILGWYEHFESSPRVQLEAYLRGRTNIDPEKIKAKLWNRGFSLEEIEEALASAQDEASD